jgi:hypothetical protein
MNDREPDGLGTLSRPRLVSDGEHELLGQWSAAVAGVTAYLCQRQSDKAELHGRIVVADQKRRSLLYVIYGPAGSDFWVILSAHEKEEIGRFPTLLAALNFVRPVLTT